MHIAVVTETWPPEINGVALTTEVMVLGMLTRGHTIDLFRPRQPEPYPVAPGLQQHLLKGVAMPWYREVRIGLPTFGYLRKQWRHKPPELVQIVTEGPLGFAAMHIARQLNIPVITEFHTNFHQYSRYYHLGFLLTLANRYLRWFHNQANVTLAPTQEQQQRLTQDGYRRVNIVARGINTRLFNPQRRSQALRKRWGVGADSLAVIHVGRLAHEKNLGLAVRAYRAIQGQCPDSRMIFVGDGPARKQLEKDNPDFVFCGMQTGEALGAHYASGDLFLSPSTSETFGNVTLEAMASRLGIVCFDYAAAHKYLISGQHGLSVAVDDNQAFIDSALTLAHADTLRQRMAQAAYEVVQDISWEKMVERFEAQAMAAIEHAGLQPQIAVSEDCQN